jgi:kynurenine formamidase
MSEDEVIELLDSCSNAGRWGPDDELGTLNYITNSKRVEAAQLVRDGRALSIGKDLDTVWSLRNTTPVVHRMLYLQHESPTSSLDSFDIASHGFSTTHLDALGHVYFEGKIYNGRKAADVVTREGLTSAAIHAYKEGIMTRGVLLDIAAARGVEWLKPDEGVWPEDLDRAEELAGVAVSSGDAIFVRVGLSAREAVEGNEDPAQRAGLMAECLPWLHEREVAVFSGDCIERLPQPYSRIHMPLHMVGLVAMGLAILDATELEELRSVCRELNRYEFMVTCAPLRLRGGTGSPVNPICVF